MSWEQVVGIAVGAPLGVWLACAIEDWRWNRREKRCRESGGRDRSLQQFQEFIDATYEAERKRKHL